MKGWYSLLFLVLYLNGIAQKADDIKKFENLFQEPKPAYNWRAQLKDNKNEISFVFSAVFVAYKELLSSQDIDACVFTPSCSVYAIESIKEEGIIRGYLNAIDRLTRCNPGRHKNLPIDASTGKYFDPVDPAKK